MNVVHIQNLSAANGVNDVTANWHATSPFRPTARMCSIGAEAAERAMMSISLGLTEHECACFYCNQIGVETYANHSAAFFALLRRGVACFLIFSAESEEGGSCFLNPVWSHDR